MEGLGAGASVSPNKSATAAKAVSETRPNGLVLSYTYYAGNDRLESLTESGGGASRTIRWTYLATGEVASITLGDGSPAATTLTFGYDNARRLEKVTDGAGNSIQYTLGNRGQPRGGECLRREQCAQARP